MAVVISKLADGGINVALSPDVVEEVVAGITYIVARDAAGAPVAVSYSPGTYLVFGLGANNVEFVNPAANVSEVNALIHSSNQSGNTATRVAAKQPNGAPDVDVSAQFDMKQ